MSLGRNLLAGLANSVWSALIGLAVVPFYLKYLGIEAYGLIGFFVTTQAVLSILDMGMAPTINREVARCSASGDLKEAGKLLHTLAVVYWCMAVAIALLILALAPWIAEYWLQSKQLSPQTISHAVMLMGLVVACRWPIGLYQGALIGAQRLTVSSGINMVMATLSSLGAVGVLAFVSPTIEAFFIWQASVGLVYAITMRLAAWKVIGKSERIGFNVNELKRVWRFTAGMSAISIIGIIFTQLDKVLLSKFLSLEEFGHYMLATVVVSGLNILIASVYNIAYPRFSAIVASGDMESLGKQYKLFTRVLFMVLFPAAMILVIFPNELVQVWTGNEKIAEAVAPVISLLAIGAALNGLMHIPHALQLAYGMTRLPLIINGVLMVIIIPLIIMLTIKYGAVGGAMAWALLNFLYVFLGTWLTHRYLLKNMGKEWLINDVGLPIGMVLMTGVLIKLVGQYFEYSIILRLIIGCFGVIVLFSVGILTTPRLRLFISRRGRNFL